MTTEREDRKPIGRPSKYKPEYCQQLIDFMAQGYPYECFAAELSVGKTTLYRWEEEHDAFRNAKKVGKMKTYKALLEKGMDSLHDPGTLNNTVWIFMMKNMCNWSDRREETIQAKIEVTPAFEVVEFDESESEEDQAI